MLAAEDRVRRPQRGAIELLARDAADSAVEAGFLEDRFGELGPRAVALGGHMPEAAGQLEQLRRRLCEVADVRG